jgi:hypothetical protein
MLMPCERMHVARLTRARTWEGEGLPRPTAAPEGEAPPELEPELEPLLDFEPVLEPELAADLVAALELELGLELELVWLDGVECEDPQAARTAVRQVIIPAISMRLTSTTVQGRAGFAPPRRVRAPSPGSRPLAGFAP